MHPSLSVTVHLSVYLPCWPVGIQGMPRICYTFAMHALAGDASALYQHGLVCICIDRCFNTFCPAVKLYEIS